MKADLSLVRRLAAADQGLAVVALARDDGSVQASLVNAGVLDDPISSHPVVGFVVRAATTKVRLLRRRSRATVVFRAGWEWVAVDGPAHLIGPDDLPNGFAPERVPDLLRGVFRAAGGTHDDWDTYDRVMAAERRLAVLIEPARIASNG